MYALINHTSYNAKDIVFSVYYNDIMYELHGIEINGTYYNLTENHQEHIFTLFQYMRSRINVWNEIKKYQNETSDAFFC